ncbi:MAG TPA: hypothetical protein VGR25_10745 [bacterium]|nr:hypothetical protein [bacterium]
MTMVRIGVGRVVPRARSLSVLLLLALALFFPWPTDAAERGPRWQFYLIAHVVGRQGDLLVLEGQGVFDLGGGYASGGGSFVRSRYSGSVSAGHWTVLNLVGWHLPGEDLRRTRDELDLDLLVSLPLGDTPFSIVQVGLQTIPSQALGWLRISLTHPDFPLPGHGTAIFTNRPP